MHARILFSCLRLDSNIQQWLSWPEPHWYPGDLMQFDTCNISWADPIRGPEIWDGNSRCACHTIWYWAAHSSVLTQISFNMGIQKTLSLILALLWLTGVWYIFVLKYLSSFVLGTVLSTGRARLIRSHSSARKTFHRNFELSGTSK